MTQSVNKKGQMKLSFGMIFSIILIILFIAFAFYGITKFLSFQDTVKTEQFVSNLQLDIDKMWQSSGGSVEAEYLLPTKIEAVCFQDDEYENLVFRSGEFVGGKMMTHLNITKMTGGKELCFDTVRGKISFVIEKDYGDALVILSKQ